MDPQTFMDIATKVTKLKMFPYFDIAHYMLMCMSVRDDLPATSSGGNSKFIKIHKVVSSRKACRVDPPTNFYNLVILYIISFSVITCFCTVLSGVVARPVMLH